MAFHPYFAVLALIDVRILTMGRAAMGKLLLRRDILQTLNLIFSKSGTHIDVCLSSALTERYFWQLS